MDFRLLSVVATAKATRFFLRNLGTGATAAPGLLGQYIDSKALKKLSQSFPNIILVSGTNGKTTTARLISSFLNAASINHLDNREGSNLYRGLVSSLAANSTMNGRAKFDTAVLEVDEAALPTVVSQVNPRIIVLTNLFRDQLDRYGEVDSIRRIWESSVRNLDKTTTLILNADDPSLASLEQTRAKLVFYGINERDPASTKQPEAADYLNCVRCSQTLKYSTVFLSHLGHYRCENCGFARPRVDFSATKVELRGLRGADVDLIEKRVRHTLESPLPGLYNVYNLLAAVSVARQLGVDYSHLEKALKGFKPAFGRTERLQIDGKKIYTSLVKNPTGFNEVLKTVFSDPSKKYVLIAINDLIADGRDVSWLWDVDFEFLKGKTKKILVSGIRASDMELRLKYAQVENVTRVDDLEKALEQLVGLADNGETVFVLPTYTAMLRFKSLLAKRGLAGNFWEE